MYLYECGAGMSGSPKRVIDYASDEIIYADGEIDKNELSSVKFENVHASKVHRMIPHKGGAITNISDGKTKYVYILLVFSVL